MDDAAFRALLARVDAGDRQALLELADYVLELSAPTPGGWTLGPDGLVVDGDGHRVGRVPEYHGPREAAGGHAAPHEVQRGANQRWIAHARQAGPVLAQAVRRMIDGD